MSSNYANDKPSCELNIYNMGFLSEGISLFNGMGEVNRLKIFTRMRFFHEKVSDYMKIKKTNNKIT